MKLPWAGLRTRTWVARIAVLLCVVFGVCLRIDYGLSNHHARHFASSDAGDYLERAQALLAHGAARNIMDTIWPPGTSALWAALSALDASQEVAALFNVLASVAVMLLTAATAGLFAGPQAGLIALALAALHPGFIHYAGYFLAEQPFQLSVALAVFLSASELKRSETAIASSPGRGVVCGAAWALACLFRPNALPVLIWAALMLGLWSVRRRDARLLKLGLGAVLGLTLVLGAAAQRCTSVAGGHFCVISNNVAMNMALGQAGQVYGLEFRDPARPAETTAWVPPALLHHGYTGMDKVPATIFDSSGVLRWVVARVAAQPGPSAVRAVGNALDLFGMNYWPDAYGNWAQRTVTVWKQLFALFVLLPALAYAAILLRSASRGSLSTPLPVFVLGGMSGLLVSAALSMGEARYRIPFDVLLITLASAAYVGTRAASAPPPRLLARAWVAWGCVIMLCSAGIVALTHPALNDGTWLPQRAATFHWPGPERAHVIEQRASAFLHARAPGSAWDAPGNFIWHCTPQCPELRLSFDTAQSAKQLSLALDHNDRYRVLFYRAGLIVGHADVGFTRGPAGLQVSTLTVPPSAAAFDHVGVQPLYGDGAYALGHLLLR